MASEPSTIIDEAISRYVTALNERDQEQRGPVLAWVAVAVVDDNGDEEASFVISSPAGQRGFFTRGLLLDALDAMRIQT